MKRNKWIGFLLIIVALLIIIFYFFKPSDTSKSDAVTQQKAVTKSEKSNTQWDGDSVDIDILYNENLGNCGLNEEVLEKINHSTDAMTEQMQMYLVSEFDIENVEKVIWDQTVLIDYQNHQIQLVFEVTADTNCIVQCIYSQNADTWSFFKL